MRALALLGLLAVAGPWADLPAHHEATGPPADRTVAAPDGVSIRYSVEGRGKTALVLVHCWAGDRHLWDGTVERFRDRYCVVALDLAGHGASGRNRKAWTIEAFGADVAAVVSAEKLERVVLVGHSMGGPVILEAAKLLGPRVQGLVAVDTLLNVEEGFTPEEVQKYLVPFEADFRKAADDFLRGYMFTKASDPSLIDRLVAKTQAMPVDIAVSCLRGTWTYDEKAGFLAQKARIVAINSDKFPTNVEANRRYAPGYEALIMTGGGGTT